MNDFCKGALEALAWVELLLRESHNPGLVAAELRAIMQDVLDGVAVDFPERILVALPRRQVQP